MKMPETDPALIRYEDMTAHIRDKIMPYVEQTRNLCTPGKFRSLLVMLGEKKVDNGYGREIEVAGQLLQGKLHGIGRYHDHEIGCDWEANFLEDKQVGLCILSSNH